MAEPNSRSGPAIGALAADVVCTALVFYACGRIAGLLGVVLAAIAAVATSTFFPRTANNGFAYDLVPQWIASMCAAVVIAAI